MGCRRWLLIVLGVTILSGCSSASQLASPSPLATVVARPLPSAEMSQSLSFDAANRTATLTMVANVPGTPSDFNYNGYTTGALVIPVPKGWDVTVHCNDDPAATYAHSCTVVRGPEAKTPAFPGAILPDPTGTGFVTAGEKKTFRFTAGAPLVGRFACLVLRDDAGEGRGPIQDLHAGEPSLGTKLYAGPALGLVLLTSVA